VALPSPAGPNSAQPQLTVSSRGVLLSWIERDGEKSALRFAERTTTGWTAARTVASGSDWFVNWADVPSVLRLSDGSLYGHWLQKSGADTYAYDVRPRDRQTVGAPGAPRSRRIATVPRPSTASLRCSRCRAPASGWCGSTAARCRPVMASPAAT
jgi:hypothetical protein